MPLVGIAKPERMMGRSEMSSNVQHYVVLAALVAGLFVVGRTAYAIGPEVVAGQDGIVVVYLPYDSDVTVKAVVNSSAKQRVLIKELATGLPSHTFEGSGENKEIGSRFFRVSQRAEGGPGYRVEVKIENYSDYEKAWKNSKVRKVRTGHEAPQPAVNVESEGDLDTDYKDCVVSFVVRPSDQAAEAAH